MGETGRRVIETIKNHSGGDYTLHMVKPNIEASQADINTANFEIFDLNFSNNKNKRKVFES